MKRVNKIISEIGISKVKLAKYLGVSRQMVYNYLEMDDINDLPLEKKMKLFTLLNISDTNEIDNIKLDNDFIKHANSLINSEVEEGIGKDLINFSDINIDDQKVLNDIIYILKDILSNNDNESSNICKYLYHFLQSISSMPEIKYMLAYIAKATGFEDANTYVFDKDKQFRFESILFTSMVFYTNGSMSTEKLIETHKKFAQKIEEKKEERLSRTQELYTAQAQALKELGYDALTSENAAEVLEKIAEIESRGI